MTALARRASRCMLFIALLACLATCATASGAADHEAGASPNAASSAGWQRATCADGIHTLAWRATPDGVVPRNSDFDVELELSANGVPRSVEGLALSGWMPAHNHGLVQLPSVHEVGTGRYRIEGVLLHMRGKWELRFSFVDGAGPETITFELEL